MNFVQVTNDCYINLDNVTRVQFLSGGGANVYFGTMMHDGETPDFYNLAREDARGLSDFLSGEYRALLTKLQEEQEAGE